MPSLHPNRGQFGNSLEHVRASLESAWSRVARAVRQARHGADQRRATMHRPAFIGAGALFLRDAFDRVHGRVHRFRSQHGAVSAVAAVALLLALVVGGVALANVASAGPNVVIANVATHYVNLPGEDGKQAKVLTKTVTIPGKGKVVRVRKIVTKEDTTTTRLPGQTVAVNGPTHTVTVAGPTKTVTETVTQTETVEVTTTVDGGPPGPP